MSSGDDHTLPSGPNQARRLPDGTFAKGTSGNPTGRPKGSILVREAIAKRGPEIIDELLSIALTSVDKAIAAGESPMKVAETSDRIRAMALLLAYWIGKPREVVDVKHTVEDRRIADQLDALRKSDAGAHLLAVAEALTQTMGAPKS